MFANKTDVDGCMTEEEILLVCAICQAHSTGGVRTDKTITWYRDSTWRRFERMGGIFFGAVP